MTRDTPCGKRLLHSTVSRHFWLEGAPGVSRWQVVKLGLGVRTGSRTASGWRVRRPRGAQVPAAVRLHFAPPCSLGQVLARPVVQGPVLAAGAAGLRVCRAPRPQAVATWLGSRGPDPVSPRWPFASSSRASWGCLRFLRGLLTLPSQASDSWTREPDCLASRPSPATGEP